jgi:hypothetical protein
MKKQIMYMGSGEPLTERTPVAKNNPSAISKRPDKTRRKLQKLPKSITFNSPVVSLLPPVNLSYRKKGVTSKA